MKKKIGFWKWLAKGFLEYIKRIPNALRMLQECLVSPITEFCVGTLGIMVSGVPIFFWIMFDATLEFPFESFEWKKIHICLLGVVVFGLVVLHSVYRMEPE